MKMKGCWRGRGRWGTEVEKGRGASEVSGEGWEGKRWRRREGRRRRAVVIKIRDPIGKRMLAWQQEGGTRADGNHR